MTANGEFLLSTDTGYPYTVLPKFPQGSVLQNPWVKVEMQCQNDFMSSYSVEQMRNDAEI